MLCKSIGREKKKNAMPKKMSVHRVLARSLAVGSSETHRPY
jgi:hypothetical protein